MALTARLVETAEAGDKLYRLTDQDRLSLAVAPSGTKSWHFRYRYQKKRDLVVFGMYPDVTLPMARDLATEAKGLLIRGIDPATRFRRWRKEKVHNGSVASTVSVSSKFPDVVDEYYSKRRGILSDKHIERIIRLFRTHMYPTMGDHYISAIQPIEILRALQTVEQRSPEIAHRLLIWSNQVFRYAVATQRIVNNPAVSLKGALRPLKRAHHAAITDPDTFGQLLRDIERAPRTPTGVGLRLMPLLFIRPGELRHARWSEFDLEKLLAGQPSVWEIPGERMKMNNAHMVPLSAQATQLFKELYDMTCRKELVFSSNTGKPISDAAMNVALRKVGYPGDKMTIHGFRASARTLLDEGLHYPVDIIEHQLAHTVRDPLGRAYNRTQHLDARVVMMQAWSDYLSELRGGE